MSVLSYARLMLGFTVFSLPILSTAAYSANDNYTESDANNSFITTNQQILNERPLNIALLMPSDNSPFLAVSRIVENGLLAANKANGSKANILVIESQSELSIKEKIDAAVFAGADVVVGPIQKDLVEILAAEKNLPIPIVALNIPQELKSPITNGLLMMSIATDKEAEFIAQKALSNFSLTHEERKPTVIILKSEDEWTLKLSRSYEKVLKNNGIPFETLQITLENLPDLKKMLEPSLSSEQVRHFAYLKSKAQSKLERRKVDNSIRTAIASSEPPYQIALLAMDASMASLVRNRLHLRMQVWATSTTNPGDTLHSPTAKALAYDLNKVHFADSPIVLNYDENSFVAKFSVTKPYSLSAQRLFGLGADAYTVASMWAHNNSQFSLSGETGELVVSPSSSFVERTPITAIIENGIVYNENTLMLEKLNNASDSSNANNTAIQANN